MKINKISAMIFFTLFLFSIQALPEPIGLEQVIREVCTNSDSVKMMNETVKKSEQSVREQWAAALPKISLSASAIESYGSLFGSSSSSSSSSSTHSNNADYVTQEQVQAAIQSAIQSVFSKFADPQISTIYSTGLSFSQPIYTFGKVGTALKVAKQYDKSVRFNYQRNIQNLQLAAFDLYFRTLIADRSAEISRHALSRKKELNSFLERNFELGSGSKAQVLSTSADLASHSASLLVAERDARTAMMSLNMFMGRPLTDSILLDTMINIVSLQTFDVPDVERAVDIACKNRMDLKTLRLLAESNRNGAKIYKAMYLPSISALGSLGYSKMESDLYSTDGTSNWMVGLGLSWTLFDGFSSSAKASQYISDANKLDLAYHSLSSVIEIEIRSDIAECSAADSNYAASQVMFNAAKESYDLTNSNFRQGSGQFADLQLSDEMLRQAELGLVNAKYRLLRSRAALMVAMGQDIVPLDSDKSK
jgi:outer membrane protein